MARGDTAAFFDDDFAVLVSSGIGTLLEPLVSCWLPTLAQLLALNVPLCLTCYHEGEAAGEEAGDAR